MENTECLSCNADLTETSTQGLCETCRAEYCAPPTGWLAAADAEY